jgi:hypothetical protein
MRLPTKRKAQRQRPDAGGHPRAAASPLRASSRSTVPDMPPSSPSQRRYTGTMASWISTPAARPSALATVFRRRAELSIRGSVTDTRSTKAPARRRRAVAARPCVSVAHVHCLLMASRRRQPRTPRTSSATALRVIPAQTGIQRRNDTGSPLPRGRHRICGQRDPTLRRAAQRSGHPASTRSVSFPRKRDSSDATTLDPRFRGDDTEFAESETQRCAEPHGGAGTLLQPAPCHSRASGNPATQRHWVPASAGTAPSLRRARPNVAPSRAKERAPCFNPLRVIPAQAGIQRPRHGHRHKALCADAPAGNCSVGRPASESAATLLANDGR